MHLLVQIDLERDLDQSRFGDRIGAFRQGFRQNVLDLRKIQGVVGYVGAEFIDVHRDQGEDHGSGFPIDVHLEQGGIPRGALALVEDEVAEAVENDAVFIEFNGLQNVRMAADDNVRAGFNELMGDLPLGVRHGGNVFLTEVNVCDRDVGLQRGLQQIAVGTAI